MKIIPYDKSGTRCLTACPYGKQRELWTIKVDSMTCQECESFLMVDEKLQRVLCGYDEKGIIC